MDDGEIAFVRILIAPDKFKGALSARGVAENIAGGIREVCRDVEIETLPMADGGEGTAEVICDALQGSWVKCNAHDPLDREIEARYCWVEARQLAVMEMSEAAGMRRLRPNELNPDLANTFGVGEMLLAALKRGAAQIIIGLGGSATNDGGFGMARALGFRFFAGSKELSCRISELANLTRVGRPSPVASRLPRGRDRVERRDDTGEGELFLAPKIIAAADVRNPLLGENGATRVFGPQKGVTEDKMPALEDALTNLANVITKELGVDYRDAPGAGAAGGLGFGLMSFCGTNVEPGFDIVAEIAGLESKIRTAEVVITGEGSLDRQTLEGKTPAGVARLARKFGKRVFAFVGRTADDPEVEKLFDGVYQNARPDMSAAENMKRAAELLRENARTWAKEL